ncbi:GRIP domain-containing protein, partial [Neolecta irregularis DAH-3]
CVNPFQIIRCPSSWHSKNRLRTSADPAYILLFNLTHYFFKMADVQLVAATDEPKKLSKNQKKKAKRTERKRIPTQDTPDRLSQASSPKQLSDSEQHTGTSPLESCSNLLCASPSLVTNGRIYTDLVTRETTSPNHQKLLRNEMERGHTTKLDPLDISSKGNVEKHDFIPEEKSHNSISEENSGQESVQSRNGMKRSNTTDLDALEIYPQENINSHDSLSEETRHDSILKENAGLEESIQLYRNEIASLKSVINKLDTSTQSNFAENKRLKLENESLERKMESLLQKDRSSATAQDLSSLEDESSNKEIEKMILENKRLESELEVLRKQANDSDLQLQLTELQIANTKISNKNIQLEAQYKNLLGKITQFKSQISEKVKSDAEEIAHSRETIKELETENESLKMTLGELQLEIVNSTNESEKLSLEVSTIRTQRMNSEVYWSKEREEMRSRERGLVEAVERLKREIREWEMTTAEERSMKESLEARICDLEDALEGGRGELERYRSLLAAEGEQCGMLKRTLNDVQEGRGSLQEAANVEARRIEVIEIKEEMEKQVGEISAKARLYEKQASEALVKLEETRVELERLLPMEKEVKEKNLQIGKLRHEAVILNEHLTKALRLLKRGSSEDTVDRTLISNLFLSFVAIPRGDGRKFEVLQLLGSLLAWDDEQREKAGLSRPGSAMGEGLLAPGGMFRRVSSTAQMHSALDMLPSESMGDLWINFLERQAAQGMSG